jgi:hypothetical protein
MPVTPALEVGHLVNLGREALAALGYQSQVLRQMSPIPVRVTDLAPVRRPAIGFGQREKRAARRENGGKNQESATHGR